MVIHVAIPSLLNSGKLFWHFSSKSVALSTKIKCSDLSNLNIMEISRIDLDEACPVTLCLQD